MNHIEINNRTKSKINLSLVKRTVNEFLESNRLKNKSVSVVITGDKIIRRLNKIYLGNNASTDVLAFSGEKDYFGEVVIDYQQIKRQAKRYENSIQRELIFVLVHGLLHLLGYSDKTKKARNKMMKLGEMFIGNL